MTDFNSSLPVRTETKGDVVAKIVDTAGTNELAVNSSGQIAAEVFQGTASSLKAEVSISTSANSVKVTDGTDTLLVNEDGNLTVAQKSGDVWDVNLLESGTGDEIHHYEEEVNVGSGLTGTHSYTPNSGKTLYFKQVEVSASGKWKCVIAWGTTGSEADKFVMFGQGSDSFNLPLSTPAVLVDTQTIKLTLTNRDKSTQSLYSTIVGLEK